MKPCLKTRRDKSACANIFLELPLTNLFRDYFGMNVTSSYWSYIDFYTLITYASYITFTYNHDTATGAEFRSSRRRCFQKFCKFHKKSPVLGSLFYKVVILQAYNVIKKRFQNFQNLRNSEEHLFSRTSERLLLCIDYWFLQFTTLHVFYFQNTSSYYTIKTIELMKHVHWNVSWKLKKTVGI